MNRRQMIVLWTGIILFILMGLFPPVRRSYGFLLTQDSEDIQFQKLLIQWLILAAGIAGLIYYLRGKKKMDKLQQIVIVLAIMLLLCLLIVAVSQPEPRSFTSRLQRRRRDEPNTNLLTIKEGEFEDLTCLS